MMSILFFLIFHDFTAIFISITLFGKVHRPCKQYPNIVTNSHNQHHPPNNPLHGPWQTKSSWSCFPELLGQHISFWFSGYNLLVTIFRIVHRPCRHYFIIVNKSPHGVHSFALVSWLYLHQLPYWEMQTDHVNNASTLSKRYLAILG